MCTGGWRGLHLTCSTGEWWEVCKWERSDEVEFCRHEVGWGTGEESPQTPPTIICARGSADPERRPGRRGTRVLVVAHSPGARGPALWNVRTLVDGPGGEPVERESKGWTWLCSVWRCDSVLMILV